MRLSADLVAKLSASVWGWGEEGIDAATARQLGLDAESRPLRLPVAPALTRGA